MIEFDVQRLLSDYADCLTRRSAHEFKKKYYHKIPSGLTLEEAVLGVPLPSAIDEVFDVYANPSVEGIFLFPYKRGFEVFWAERAAKSPRWEFLELRTAVAAKVLLIFNECGHLPPDVPDFVEYFKAIKLDPPLGDGRL